MSKNKFHEMPNNHLEHDKYIPSEFDVLGRRGIRRIDGYRKASGEAIYTSTLTYKFSG